MQILPDFNFGIVQQMILTTATQIGSNITTSLGRLS